MKCPMTADSCGSMSECYGRECAWWNNEKAQCCIKTISNASIIENKTPKEMGYRRKLIGGMDGVYETWV